MTTVWSLGKPWNIQGSRNADGLNRLLEGSDNKFDGEEMGEEVDKNVCTFHMINWPIMQDDPKQLVKEISKPCAITQAMCCVKDGWQNQRSDKLQDYKKWMINSPLNTDAYSMGQGLYM